LHKLVVQKFGGTSVQDAEAMRRVMSIVREKGVTRQVRPLVVLSACAGVTNSLIRVSELALLEDTSEAISEVDALTARHATIVRELIKDRRLQQEVLKGLGEIWSDLRKLVRGVHLLNELTLRSRDHFVSAGERASTLIFAATFGESLKKDGLEVVLFDAREFFITSRDFSRARPLVKDIERKMRPVRAKIVQGAIGVTQGFIGSTTEGVTTTVGRGGSDFSAAIMGVAVRAKDIQIWTDVAGIFTCDPRLTPAAEPVPVVSFAEASALALFGAKVLHPETIWPAVEKGIPVRVLSSQEPEAEGTTILGDVDETKPLTGIAFKRNILLAQITPLTALPTLEAHSTLWEILEESNAVPLAISQAAHHALYVFEESSIQTALRHGLQGLATVEFWNDRSLVTLVGPGLQTNAGIALRIFKAVGKTNCELITYGGSRIVVSLVVPDEKLPLVVKRLHKEFFE
jgi:aspartate kinase